METIDAVTALTMAGLSLREICALQPGDIRPGMANVAKRNVRALTRQEAATVLAATDRSGSLRDRAMIRMALYVGARQIELRRLTCGDISRSTNGLYATLTGKGGKTRRVWLPPDLAVLVTMLSGRHPRARIFHDHDGAALTKWEMYSTIRRYMPQGGPHRLRHTAATWLLGSGATLEEAMEILGHSEVSSHEVYAAASEGWLLDQWTKYHPASRGAPPDAHIFVRGKPFERHMARGVERVVPVYDMDVTLPPPPYRAIIREFARKSPTNPSQIRKRLSVTLAENGMHPFAMSLILGVTPDHVVASAWERKGVLADLGRREAIQRAIMPVTSMEATA